MLGTNYLWVKPGEDLVLYVDFDRDVTGATHVLEVTEYGHRYQPHSYDEWTDLERTTFDTSDEANGIIKHTIDADTLDGWGEKRLNLTWRTTEDGNTWVVSHRRLTVGEGT